MTTQVTPKQSGTLMSNLTDILGLFEGGAKIYNSVTERTDADEIIAGDTVKADTVVVSKDSTNTTIKNWVLPVAIGAGLLVVVILLVVIFKRRR